MFEWFEKYVKDNNGDNPMKSRIEEVKAKSLEKAKEVIHPEIGIVNEIEAILHLLRLPNFSLPSQGEHSFSAAEKIRIALMNVRKKLEQLKKRERL